MEGEVFIIGGKVTLLNSFLNSIHIFMLSFYKALKCVLEDIIKIQRDFLWGNMDRRWKVCWVCSNEICLAVKKGGLGVKNIETCNYSLMSK